MSNNPQETQNTQMVEEAVAVFHSADDLQAAMDELQSNGFMRQELSILADEKAVEEKLGHHYKKVRAAEDDKDAPRTIFIPNETIGEAEGSAIGLPLYLAATTAAAVTVASGGTALAAAVSAAAAGAAGAGIGGIFARMIAKHHADFLQEQVDLGGILLWVNLRSPDMIEKATAILKKHSAHDVHVHRIPV